MIPTATSPRPSESAGVNGTGVGVVESVRSREAVPPLNQKGFEGEAVASNRPMERMPPFVFSALRMAAPLAGAALKVNVSPALP